MTKHTHLKEWLKLPDVTKLNIYTETGRRVGLPAVAIEKDWWVVHTMALVFSMECAPALVFKGGTSLSKGWNLIQRFSEDIDLVIDREYLGFTGELSKGDIRRLRRRSYEFMTTTFIEELRAKFAEAGFEGVTLNYKKVINHDQDPIIIEIYYPNLTEKETYLKPGVLVEVGCRSLKEPNTDRTFSTIVAENFAGSAFADTAITVPVVNPERTFLEKVFLLHEEFQKKEQSAKVERLSRHLYDIEKLDRSEYSDVALLNTTLYKTIVAHREKFTPVTGVDYAYHAAKHIRFIPPKEILHHWEADYKQMQENMIYGDNLPFPKLIQNLNALQRRINNYDINFKELTEVITSEIAEEVRTDKYKQTEVGLIPEDWEVKELGKLIEFSGGSQPPLTTFIPVQKQGYIRLLQIRDYKTDKYKTYIPIQFARKFCKKEDIMIGRYGPPIFQILRGLEGAYNVALIKAIPSKEINKDYAYHFFKQSSLFDFVENLSQRSSGQTGVDLQQLKTYPLGLPSLKEQAFIAKALSDTNALITNLEKLITKKRNIKQGAMQELLRPKEAWKEKKLGDIAEVVGGGTPSTFHPIYWNGTINWFTPTEIGKHKYTFNSIRKITKEGLLDCSAKILPIGTILLTTRAGIGDLSILMAEGCTNQGFQSLIAKSGINNEYLYYLVSTLKNILLQNASGSTFLEISPGKIKQISVHIPSKEEQNQIASALSEMDSEITTLETKLSKYKQIKQGMMQNLLTGKIRLV
ncbi:MAG: restriction endonuclease subunit S [Opitutaceae bacterium]|nr:restriction endonuclease subunit S [Cytophagales bacterium]